MYSTSFICRDSGINSGFRFAPLFVGMSVVVVLRADWASRIPDNDRFLCS